MKLRIVSTLLVLCMLLSMIPAVFAEPDRAGTPVEPVSVQPTVQPEAEQISTGLTEWEEEEVARWEAQKQEERAAEQKRIEEETLRREETEREARRKELEQKSVRENEEARETKQEDSKIWTSVDQNYFNVSYGDIVTLKVDRVYDNYGALTTDVTYQWYDADTEKTVNSKTASYTTAKIVRNRSYYCLVTDKDGNTTKSYFYVYVDNNLSVRPADNNWEVYVDYGGKATLKVVASADITDGMTYQWSKLDENWNGTEISGATKASYTTPAIKKLTRFRCWVTDKFGNSSSVTIDVHVDNQLSVVSALSNTNYDNRQVPVGEKTSLKLKVTAKDKTNMTYTWYRIDEHWVRNQLDTTATTSLTTGAIKEYRRYTCVVKDRYDNSQEVTFNISVDNNLRVVSTATEDNYEERGVTPGTKATLKLKVTATDKDGMTYTWSRRDENWNWTTLDTTATTSLTTGAIKEPRYYRCEVMDKFGNRANVDFSLYAENHFKAVSAETDDTFDSRGVQAEAKAALKLKLSGDDLEGLTYQWYRSYTKDDGTYVETKVTGTKTSCTTAAIKRPNTYRCELTDKYGNRCVVEFRVFVENHLRAVSAKIDDIYEERYVTPGKTSSLKVKVTADVTTGLTYTWTRSYTKDDGNHITEDLPSVTGNSTTTPAIRKDYYYVCTVKDKYRNTCQVRFSVRPQNHFELNPVGNTDKFVTYGKTATLKVKATADDTTGMTYQWYGRTGNVGYAQAIPGATTASYTTAAVKGCGGYYYCSVTDKYKNTKNIWFYTYVSNNLQAEAKDRQYGCEVAYGKTATLKVMAGANNPAGITYRWYNENGERIEGATKASYTTPAVKYYTWFYCIVADKYGNQERVNFRVNVRNNLTATGTTSASGVIYVTDGTKKTLKVSATADKTDGLTYQWYGKTEHDYFDKIAGATKASYTTPAIHDYSYYSCCVTDKYGNYFYVHYDLYVGTIADQKAESITVDQTAAGIFLNWTDVPGAAKYQIQRKVGSATSWTTVATVDAKTRYYMDTNVKAGSKYKYAVRGVRSSTYSKRTISDQLTRKKMVTGISCTKQNTQIKVSWKALSGAATYNVMRRSYNHNTHVSTDWKAVKTGLKGTSFTDTTVVSGVDYYYSIQAVTSSGSKYFYDKRVGSIYFVESPKLSTATATTSGVKLTWATRKGTGRYAILRKASGATSWTRIGSTNQLSYTDTTAKKGTKYTYTIRSMDVQGKTYVSMHITTGKTVTAK